MLRATVGAIVLRTTTQEDDMGKVYDAIVVGARCGGASTAMLLARHGYEVLLVDKATFPSDTMSTHLLHPFGVAALSRWGLLDAVEALGAPPVTHYALDFDAFRIKGAPRFTPDGIGHALGPTRLRLDDVLVRAATAAGVELREGCLVEDVDVDAPVARVSVRASAGAALVESGRIVIGADGMRSRVARAVDASTYLERPTYAANYYAYWSGVPLDGIEIFVRPGRSFAAIPTVDGLTMVVMSWPRAEFKTHRDDVEGTFLRGLDLAPSLAARVAAGTRETPFAGTGDAPGFYRTPYGDNWALVGDARHHKDPCTARGMSEAFLDAEALAAALHATWSGATTAVAALGEYQRRRDEDTLAMYEFTCQLASLQPPSPDLAHLLAATSTDVEASRDFVSLLAGTVALSDFMAPDNVARILGDSSPVAAR
jgi:2-polyprenyl-6-methoxyphenol hydroxylase-like FAD-dependent oxidoreductase